MPARNNPTVKDAENVRAGFLKAADGPVCEESGDVVNGPNCVSDLNNTTNPRCVWSDTGSEDTGPERASPGANKGTPRQVWHLVSEDGSTCE